MRNKAVIVGGGIAGAAIAIVLRRLGWECEIHEGAESATDDAGAFLNVGPNGLTMLRRLGALEAVEAIAPPVERLVFRNADGQPIGHLDYAAARDQFGAGNVIVKRGLLQRVLREHALRAGARVVFGRRAAEVDAERAAVRFADGATAEGTIVLGCDGIHSAVRRRALPESPAPSDTGQISCGGYARCPGLEPGEGEMFMTFGRRAFFGHFVAPDGTIYWFSNVPSDALPADGVVDWKQILLDRHRGDPFPVELILEATNGGIGGWPIFDIPSLPRWHTGAVCLLGDAAHAISPSAGQGASLALEDAVVLGTCLRDLAPAEAFASYQTQRRPRVERIVAASRRIGEAKISRNPVANWFRDRLLGTFVRMNARSSAWMHAFDVEGSG